MRKVVKATRRGGRSNPALKTKSSSNGAGGRPTLFTPQVTDAICEALRVGSILPVAVLSAGITERTFYNWKERANPEHPEHRPEYEAFMLRIEQVMAQYCVSQMARVHHSGIGEYKDAAGIPQKYKGNISSVYFWLERGPWKHHFALPPQQTVVVPLVPQQTYDPDKPRPVIDAAAGGFLLPRKEE